MNRNILLGLFLIIAVSVTAFVLLHSSYPHSKTPLATSDKRPDAFMSAVNYSEYDDQGQLHSHLSAPKVVHYPHENSSNFTNPNFMIYTGNHVPWYISSAYGKSLDGIHLIQLWQNVNFHQPKDGNNLETTIITDAATLFPDKSSATTDQAVTVIRPDSLVKAKGMEANLKKNQIKLLSHAQGFYAAEAPPAPKSNTKDDEPS